MPVPPAPHWPTHSRRTLYELGLRRAADFCALNGVAPPDVTAVPKADWRVGACAFYRPDTDVNRKHRLHGHGRHVNVCLEHCGTPCGDAPTRNWSWPASVTDRTVYGVVCHELGHHCDWLTGDHKGRYWSDWCEHVKAAAREPGLTSYADENPAEFLAEAFRLFVTNPTLLRQLRPRTYGKIVEHCTPLGPADWRRELGGNVPARVVRALVNKGAV